MFSIFLMKWNILFGATVDIDVIAEIYKNIYILGNKSILQLLISEIVLLIREPSLNNFDFHIKNLALINRIIVQMFFKNSVSRIYTKPYNCLEISVIKKEFIFITFLK
jgi:hypothetical protein